MELTEFEALDVQKVSGVRSPANGTMHLIMKGLPEAEPEPDDVEDDEDASKAVVNGKVDQKPDVTLGEKILALIGQAMGNESQEAAAGHHGEVGDVQMLSQAHDIVRQWMNGEKTHPDGLKSEADEDDPMYDAAVRIVADTRRCSTSWIQRKLGVGYNRAAKIVEAMEKRGVVGPANGSKDREVLIGPI